MYIQALIVDILYFIDYTKYKKNKGVFALDERNELDSTCGVSDDELTKRFIEAVRIENEIKKIKGLPISKYDFEKKMPYIEYPDGRRVYAEEA